MPLPTRLLAGLLAAAMALPAAAQGQATKSLGGTTSAGPLLTREQLRSCLARQQDLAARKPPLEAEREQLERERKAYDDGEPALAGQRQAIEQLKAEAEDIGRRAEELSKRISDFNERVRRFQDSGATGPTAERQRQSLEREKAGLDLAAKELDAARSSLTARAEPLGKALNERVAQRNQAAADWNARNAQLTRSAQAYETELADWKSDCEGRSYREDDERALRSGK